MKTFAAILLTLALAGNGLAADRPAPTNEPSGEPSPLTAPLAAENPLYLDPDAPIDARVADLIGRMTLEEKAQALDHRGPTLERFGLRSDQWNQCLHGVVWTQPTTKFPTPTAMGATWNPDLVREIMAAVSDEARAIYNGWKNDPDFRDQKKGLIYRDPVINISRNPYWGRIHEVFSEDPYLTGRMAVGYVRGMQGDHPHYLKLASTLKHYAVNNVEEGRHGLNAVVPERWLYEYWLPHFRDGVVEAKACSLMASYNAINGVRNAMNHWLLTDVLKEQWNHQGFVVSDLGGVRKLVEEGMDKKEAVALCMMAGCDFSDREYRENIPAAVRAGLLTEERLDDALTRVLRVRMRLGEFDPQDRLPWSDIGLDVIGCEEHRRLSLEASRQSIVLLKNQDNFLPLDESRMKSLAVIGPLADRISRANYSGIFFEDAMTPLKGLRSRFPDLDITHVIGGVVNERVRNRRDGWPTDPAELENPAARAVELKKAVDAARSADVALVFVGTDHNVEIEGRDRKTLRLTGNQEELIKAVVKVNPRTVVFFMNAGPVSSPWVDGNVPAALQGFWQGDMGGLAIAEILFGRSNPAARLPYTIYASDEQVPPQDVYDISKGFTYMFVKGEPLYPFGHGLSYTSFEYSNLRLSDKTIAQDGSVEATVDVTNTGRMGGDEVVQVYFHDVEASVVRASRKLCGFQRISLKPGETQSVRFELPQETFAFYSEAQDRFVVEPGVIEILVGASSKDIRLRKKINIRSTAPTTFSR